MSDHSSGSGYTSEKIVHKRVFYPDWLEQFPSSEWFFLTAATFFACGILGSEIIPWPKSAYWPAVFFTACTVLWCHLRKKHRLAFFFLLPFFLFIGALYSEEITPPTDPHHIYNKITDRKEVTVTGVLTECPLIGPEKTRLRIAIKSISKQEKTTFARGFAQISLPGTAPRNIMPGDQVIARVRLSKIHNYGVPGGFDYKNFMGMKSIWVTGWISSPTLLLKIHSLKTLPLAQKLRYLPERIRYKISIFLDKTLGIKSGGLYKAILIGDRSNIAPATMENFKSSGAFHLLAISGLHVGLFGALSVFIISWLLKRSTWLLLRIPLWKTAALLSLLPLTFYALIAGFQTPVVRALIMATVFIAAFVANKQWSIPAGIGIAALLILALQPSSIHTASFQLSFAAVCSITFIYKRIKPYLTVAPYTQNKSFSANVITYCQNWGIACLAISIAAMLGTIPFLVMHFNRISLLSPISTLLVEPLFCIWGLFFGLVGSLFLPFSSWLSAWLFKIGSLGVIAADKITAWLAAIPFNSIWLPTPGWHEIALYVFFILCVFNLKKLPATKYAALIALTALIASPIHQNLERRRQTSTKVTFLDVGQGSSTFLELPHGHTLLIDGGGSQSSQFDVGERLIAPFLWKKRIARLDTLVITHPHADHYNGLPFIIKRFKPKTLWINGSEIVLNEYKELVRSAETVGAKIGIPEEGQKIYEDEQTSIITLWKGMQRKDNNESTKTRPMRLGHNDMSLVLKLVHGNRSFLFPGDIGHDIEEILLAGNSSQVKADVLLSPHHGSAGSSSAQFVKQVAPSHVVISTGKNQSGRYAVMEVINRYREVGSELLITATNGSIFFATDGNNLSLETFYDRSTEDFYFKYR